ncbi:biopolymer transporter ExbD [Arenicella chitinivorans]|uniref:Biopolymer transporter ExbD n=1 Tax=Arenicella chitinivorans TaxID=1329800 RepID=A0A918RVK7_9GAMM|nr:biopolymer transporter ExbD [Arenicella chitinivorans]GHA12380.1 biopolymer transporter ExbD [Arenicella chitinivorans]
MKRLGKANNEEETDIDITPMLDVVFIMLIFFIVTASFVKESGLDLNKPPQTDEPPDPTAPKPIVVEINKLNEITIERNVVDYRAIKSTVTRLKAERPDSNVVVRVDPKAQTKTIIQAVDGIKSANVDLPTISMTEGG